MWRAGEVSEADAAVLLLLSGRIPRQDGRVESDQEMLQGRGVWGYER